MLQPIPVSSITDLAMHRYMVQTQSKFGNWVEILGTDELEGAQRTAQYHADTRGSTVRIVDLHQ